MQITEQKLEFMKKISNPGYETTRIQENFSNFSICLGSK
jgi:hypothetical protein